MKPFAGSPLRGALQGSARFPYNTKVAAFGDSIAYGNSFSTATYIKLYAKGYLNWAAYIGRQRWTFDNADNFGVAGNNTAEALPRIDGALAASTASVFVIDLLTNDGPNGLTLAQSYANYQAILDKVLAAGRIAVLITPRPRDITASGLTMSAAQLRDHLQRREYVLGLHNPGRGIYVVDIWRYIADPTSANGACKAGFTYDGLHPSVVGGYWGGVALAELFGTGRGPGLFPFRDVMVAQNTDVWNAAYPRGCVNQNPMMAGGTSAALGYTVGGGSGVTATGSKVASGDRTDVQQLVLGGTASAAADVFDFYQAIPAGNLTVGDTVEAYADVEYDPNITGLTSHGLTLTDTSDFTKNAGCLVDSTDINALQMSGLPALSGVMRTPRLTLASTTLRLGMKGRTVSGAAVACTYRVKAMSVRKV